MSRVYQSPPGPPWSSAGCPDRSGNVNEMSALRVILCLILPPVAVIDRGLKPVLLTSVLTFLGWMPGVVAALVYSSGPKAKSYA